ncbi:MAG: MFS transporter [Gammaproteobacteria bacterium]|nr:MFS transporter [Gammaproteobacteria bacterium]
MSATVDRLPSATAQLRVVLLPISPVLLGAMLFALAHGGLFNVMGIALAEHGYPESTIGLLGSMFFVGIFVGAALTERFVRRVRHVRWFMLLAGVAGVSTVALSLTTPVVGWALLRFLAGVAMGGHWSVVEGWIQFQAHNAVRGRSLAIYECVRVLGVGASPLLLGLFAGNDAYIVAGILFTFALVPVCFLTSKEPEIAPKQQALPIAKLIACSPLGGICCMMSGFVLSAFFSMAGVFGKQSGLTAGEISGFISFVLIAPAVTQIPLGMLSDRFGRRLHGVGGGVDAGVGRRAQFCGIDGAWRISRRHEQSALRVGCVSCQRPNQP